MYRAKRLLLIAITLIMTQTSIANITPETHCFVEGEKPLWLDHYRADVEGVRPCVVFAFAGGFSRGSRNAQIYNPYFKMLLERGFDVVSFDYRLGMSYTLEEGAGDVGVIEGAVAMYRSVNYAVEDMFRATRYLLDHADEWQIDTTRIVASGSSAGAIASLQAENYICNRHRLAAILPKGFNYAGVIAFAGAIYSVFGSPDWDTTPCPMMLIHGNSDKNVPYYKATVLGLGYYGSAYIVDQLVKIKEASVYFLSAKYRDHIMAIEPLSANHEEVGEFLQRCVVKRDKWRNITDIVDVSIKPQPTEFTIQDYLNSNYAPKE